jgi:hypothetical protein
VPARTVIAMINGQSDGQRLYAALTPVIAVLRDLGMRCHLVTEVPDGTTSIIDLTGPFSLPSEPVTYMGEALSDEITAYLKNEN